MSNGLGIIIGGMVIILGFILLGIWWSMFLVVLRGIIPVLLLLTGAGILVYFISEIKSKLEMSKEDKSTPEQK